MSYDPNAWHNGDIISAEGLNHMETGIQEASETLVQNEDGTYTIVKGAASNEQ